MEGGGVDVEDEGGVGGAVAAVAGARVDEDGGAVRGRAVPLVDVPEDVVGRPHPLLPPPHGAAGQAAPCDFPGEWAVPTVQEGRAEEPAQFGGGPGSRRAARCRRGPRVPGAGRG